MINFNKTEIFVVFDEYGDYNFLSETSYASPFTGEEYLDIADNPTKWSLYHDNLTSQYMIATNLELNASIINDENAIINKFLNNIFEDAKTFKKGGYEFYKYVPIKILKNIEENKHLINYSEFIQILKTKYIEEHGTEPSTQQLIEIINSNDKYLVIGLTTPANFSSRTQFIAKELAYKYSPAVVQPEIIVGSNLRVQKRVKLTPKQKKAFLIGIPIFIVLIIILIVLFSAIFSLNARYMI
ncbi:hypothetical protein MCSF7_00186 [Mycoplasmopsis columbina SF7]|uniref:Uncharacterized protein n=1 Tax=Mycoplasmopsis columbina SF7 TaxID=1037410 RepID=F9UJJ2_9BACT|nr:hypothetical protein [Mycoplasmopsis columbina]EGV00373.1 hypothetical protein MCSF7_00186 [Mycoplasmopsis columbina SF7]